MPGSAVANFQGHGGRTVASLHQTIRSASSITDRRLDRSAAGRSRPIRRWPPRKTFSVVALSRRRGRLYRIAILYNGRVQAGNHQRMLEERPATVTLPELSGPALQRILAAVAPNSVTSHLEHPRSSNSSSRVEQPGTTTETSASPSAGVANTLHRDVLQSLTRRRPGAAPAPAARRLTGFADCARIAEAVDRQP